MKRYRLFRGKLREHPEGEWAPWAEVERLEFAQRDYEQRCHDMKVLRQAMGCDGSDLKSLLAAWDGMAAEVKQLHAEVAWCHAELGKA